MWKGERAAFDILKAKVDSSARYVWFHAASLGEFEQGRPLIEALRHLHPEYKILLTFFSPSGYEVRKDYRGADIICYLPLDTPRNARRFLHLIHPEMAFFIKYEFWYNYLHQLKAQNIPVYSVSSIFRPDQIFFRRYARSYAKVLRYFTHFFVQNEESKALLEQMGIHDVTVTGDTRFDRVLQIRQAAKLLPIVEAFKQDKNIFVAGSSWSPDEEIFIPFFNERKDWKLIIAPHVIEEAHLRQIESRLTRRTVRYSQSTEAEAREAECLIIDCFGLLSSIYRYGEIAYVGGGFGTGIHNVLEAAVWQIPVIFGPNNSHFQEAQGLLAVHGGCEIASPDDFSHTMNTFLSEPESLKTAGMAAGKYVGQLAGATQSILKGVHLTS